MSRRPARFTEADIRRARKAAGPGMEVVLDMERGTIRLIPIESVPPKQEPIGEQRKIVL